MKVRLLARSPFAKAVFALSSGTALAQAVPIVLSPLLTRFYTPKDFADYALFISVLTLILVIANGRYELAILLPKEDGKAYQLSFISIAITLILCFCSLFIVTIILFLYPDLPNLLYMLPIAVLLGGTIQTLNYLNSRKNNFALIGKSEVSRSMIVGSGNISLGLASFGGAGLIISFFFGQICQIYVLLKNTIAGLKEHVKYPLSEYKKVSREYDKFPKFSTISALLNATSSQIPIFLLSSFFAYSNVGLYFHAHKIMSLPLGFIGRAIGQVFFKQAADYEKEDSNIRELTASVVKKLFYIIVVPLSFVAVFGDILFSIIFGEQWLKAGVYAQVIAPWILINFITSPISFIFELYQKQSAFTAFNFFLLFFRLLSFLVGYSFYPSPLFVITCYAVVSALTYLAQMIYLLNLLKIPAGRLTMKGTFIAILILIPLLVIRLWMF